MSRTMAQLSDDLANLLRNFNGREYSGDIDAETLFFADLGFSSIDAVMLGEKLEQHYGQRLPFGPFLSAKARQGARDLSVGELAAFIHEQLQS